ncbi:MAG: D-2-hydroxyacid dehydrogenase [Dehalococcoidia bacterium]
MTGLLVSAAFLDAFGDDLSRAEAEAGIRLDRIVLPRDPDARLAARDVDRVELAFFSYDIYPVWSRQFFAAAQGAKNLRWLHVFNAGVDNPVFGRFLERGVRLSTSAGSTAVPIAQTAIAGLLMLARGFPHWLAAQREHRWAPLPGDRIPDDLEGQVAVIFGLGAIGREIARLARTLGLRVVGVRRTPLRPGDPVDELHHPSALGELLPRAQWLILAAPLTPETHHVIDASALALLPRGARVLNVGRGALIDEPALIEALRGGHLGGAYLDVFEEEPLPADSPLWEMPGVIITPHNSAASTGNAGRSAAMFFENLKRWARGGPLLNEVGR